MTNKQVLGESGILNFGVSMIDVMETDWLLFRNLACVNSLVSICTSALFDFTCGEKNDFMPRWGLSLLLLLVEEGDAEILRCLANSSDMSGTTRVRVFPLPLGVFTTRPSFTGGNSGLIVHVMTEQMPRTSNQHYIGHTPSASFLFVSQPSTSHRRKIDRRQMTSDLL